MSKPVKSAVVIAKMLEMLETESLTPQSRNPSLGVTVAVPYVPRAREPQEPREIVVSNPDTSTDYYLTVSPDGDYAICDRVVQYLDGAEYEWLPSQKVNGERNVGAWVMRELEYEFRKAMGLEP